MDVQISSRDAQGVTVLDLSGKVVHGDEAKAVRDAIRKLVAEGKAKIVVNLSAVSMIDSSGLGALVASFTSARAAGGDLRLTSPNQVVQKTLEMTRLAGMLEIYPAEQDALASFA